MGINFNGSAIKAIKYNSLDIAKLMYGSELVWSKAPSQILILHEDFNRPDGGIDMSQPPIVGSYLVAQGEIRGGRYLIKDRYATFLVTEVPSVDFGVSMDIDVGTNQSSFGILVYGEGVPGGMRSSPTVSFYNGVVEYSWHRSEKVGLVNNQKVSFVVEARNGDVQAFIDGVLMLNVQIPPRNGKNYAGSNRANGYGGGYIENLKVYEL